MNPTRSAAQIAEVPEYPPGEGTPGITALVRHRVVAGVLGGVAGGVVFGILMAVMGMLPVIASIIGSDSIWAGAGIHLTISMAIGMVMVGLFGDGQLVDYGRGIALGLAFGVAWWVLGPLLVLPLLLGLPIFSFSVDIAFSLMGHLLYGVTLGLVAVFVFRHVPVNAPRSARRETTWSELPNGQGTAARTHENPGQLSLAGGFTVKKMAEPVVLRRVGRAATTRAS